MPVYRYTPAKAPCKLCGDGFDHRHPGTEPALTACPTCGQAVSRVAIQQVNTPKLMKPLSISDAKRAGFTVLKRISSGEFEKQ
ncbi:MAG: zinc ribbon domain-containing protein [Verrucomicrobiota bacterium]